MAGDKKYPNPWHKDDPVKFSVVKRQWILDFPFDRVTDQMDSDWEHGKLTMKCPHCNAVNIAGTWCPKCYRMVPPEYWINLSAQSKIKRKGRRSKEDIEALFASK